MSIADKIKSDQLTSDWLIKNYNRRFKINLNNVDQIVNNLYSLGVNDNRILDLANAYNTIGGVVW